MYQSRKVSEIKECIIDSGIKQKVVVYYFLSVKHIIRVYHQCRSKTESCSVSIGKSKTESCSVSIGKSKTLISSVSMEDSKMLNFSESIMKNKT